MYGRAPDCSFEQSVMVAGYLATAVARTERVARDLIQRAAASPAERRLEPARLLANAAHAREKARRAPPGSYTRAMAITEHRCWMILARKRRGGA